jgi:hypothetical protein
MPYVPLCLPEGESHSLGSQPLPPSTFTGFFFGWVVLVSLLNLLKDYSCMGLCLLAARNLFKRYVNTLDGWIASISKPFGVEGDWIQALRG